MFWHWSMEGKTGLRSRWHFGGDTRRCLGVELAWWTTWCHVEIRVDDDGWTWALGFPPVAIWISFDGFPAWKPMRKCIATWDNNREFWLTDQRESGVSFYDWRLSLKPWAKSMEWCASDPWWVKGISFELRNLLGKQRYAIETLREGIPVVIPMPEGFYTGTAKVQRQTWKRPLWFQQTRISTYIDVPKGIPFAGKGENSWDCDDDGLFGCGVEGESVERAITHFREQVERSRKKNGEPSEQSIKEALA
jgi:hypothetical protein